MKTNTMKAAPAASAIELKNEKSAKAKRILVGADVHLRGYQAARKVDSGVIGVVENFRSQEALLLYVEKQCERAEQVVVVYEAGPLGYTLYRMLKARGVLCYVCAPDSSEQQRKRRKNNKIDARSLTSKLFNYLNGNQEALQLARVPTEAQERRRSCAKLHKRSENVDRTCSSNHGGYTTVLWPHRFSTARSKNQKCPCENSRSRNTTSSARLESFTQTTA
jgi:hypothetical protein